jgi:hypothetical protein
LCERKTAKLVETGEVLDLMITTVARDTTPKHMPRQMILGIKYQVQRLKKSVDAPCFSSAF